MNGNMTGTVILQLYYTLVYYVSTAIVIGASYDTECSAVRDPMKTPDNTSNNLNVRTGSPHVHHCACLVLNCLLFGNWYYSSALFNLLTS